MLPDWETFRAFLIEESGFGTKVSNMDANKSRFNRVVNFFDGKKFTRENFRILISQMSEAELSPATINKHISMAKQIDKYFHDRDKTPLVLANYKYRKEDDLKQHEIFTLEEMLAIRDYEHPYKKFKNELNLRAKAKRRYLLKSQTELRDSNTPIPTSQKPQFATEVKFMKERQI